MADHAASVRSIYDALERHDYPAIAEHLADDVTFNDAPRNQIVHGQKDLTAWYANWTIAFPDAVANATVTTMTDDTVTIEGVFEGTNTEALGPLPPTGKSVSVPWASVLRFNPAGQVTAGSAYFDQLTLMIQLGHLDPPTGA